jgi:Chitin binding Peritrophin-A domain
VTSPADICVGVPNFAYVRYPNSCYRYVQCVNDVAYSFQCAPGLWFNEDTSECDDPANVDCDSGIPTPAPTTTTPAPPSDGCDGVPDGQFIRSPVACHTFYRCENNEVAETYDCPIGEWFDEERQECNIIDNVECDIGGTTTTTLSPGGDICENVADGQFVRSPDDCHIFFECNGGEAEEMECPIGEWFDVERQECDLIDNVDCDAGGVTTTPYPTPPSTEDICRDMDDYMYVPSPTSCSLFYMCLSEIPYLISCPPGQWFDFELQGCDVEENVECNIVTTASPSTTMAMEDENARCIGVEDYTYILYPIPYIPSFESCNEYYMCRNDTAYLQSCPPGTYFDMERQTCDLPQNVVCDITTTQSTEPTESPTIPSPAPTTTTIAPPEDICEGVPDGQFVRSPFSCYIYHVCEDGDIDATRFCPIGEWFDQERQECDTIDNVDCDIGEPTTPSPGGDICEGIPDGQFVRSPDACHVFYECTGGNAEEMMCPIGEWFDVDRQECDIIDNVDCDVGGSTTPSPGGDICEDVPEGQFVRSPDACHIFYECNGGNAEEMMCPIGEWFDVGRQECDMIDNVDCELNGTITTTASTTTSTTTTVTPTPEICEGVPDGQYVRSPYACELFYYCLDGVGDVRSCPIGEWFEEDLQECDLIENVVCELGSGSTTPATDDDENARCVGVEDYTYIPSFESCNEYYMCRNDTAYLQSCPPGTYFDMERQTCDLPQNVVCDITTTQSTEPTESPTIPSPAPTTTTIAPPEDICEGVPDGQFVRSPFSCYIYHVCEDGDIEATRFCPIGEWFDQELQECDNIDNVDCDIGEPTTPSPGGDICEGIPNGQFVRSPDACHIFYECNGGNAEEMICPIGEWFDVNRQECDIIDNVDCDVGGPTTPGGNICEDVPDGQFVRSPDACYIFYECNGGNAEEMMCPIGEWFDVGRQECDIVDNVDCELGGANTTSTTTSTTTVTPTPEICEGIPDGQYVRSPYACELFYSCLVGVGDVRSCPIGEWFEEDLQECDLIENVVCELGTGSTTPATDEKYALV